MTTAPVPGFPNSPQTDYARIAKTLLPGSLWEEELWNARPLSATLPALDAVPFEKTFTIGNSTADGDTGVSIDGGEIVITPSGNNTTDAAALAAKILAAGFAAVYIDTAVPAAAVITVIGQPGQDPVILPITDGSTTLVIGIVTAAVLPIVVCFGEGVVRYDDGTGLNRDKFTRATSLTDKFMGVLLRTTGAKMPAGQLAEYDPTLDPDNAVPGHTYSIERENVGVVVDYVGAAPGMTDDVYFVMVGDNAGKWAKTDGGTSQVTRGDVEFNGVEVVGLAVDALPDLTVLSDTNDDTTATALRDAWNASAQHSAVAAAAVDFSGAESFIDLAFVGTAVHTVVAVSPATADVVGIVNTATAVAANALAHPEYSWGAPSIIAAADEPARAFLRLSRS